MEKSSTENIESSVSRGRCKRWYPIDLGSRMINCAAATQGKEEEGEGVWRKNKARKSSKSKWCVDIMRAVDVALDATGETFGFDPLETP